MVYLNADHYLPMLLEMRCQSRHLEMSVESEIESYRTLGVQAPRRSGKTTLISDLYDELTARNFSVLVVVRNHQIGNLFPQFIPYAKLGVGTYVRNRSGMVTGADLRNPDHFPYFQETVDFMLVDEMDISINYPEIAHVYFGVGT